MAGHTVYYPVHGPDWAADPLPRGSRAQASLRQGNGMPGGAS